MMAKAQIRPKIEALIGRMLSKGEEPMWISRVMLGHSSLNQTFSTYAKYLPKSVKERATFLNDMEF